MKTEDVPKHVRDLLDYDPDTGIFTWKNRPRHLFQDQRSWATWNSRFSGKRAGSRTLNGYWFIAIHSRFHFSHRLAWAHVHEAWPREQIDHINGNREDNRIANLREATAAENQQNICLQKNSSSGIKGVNYDKRRGKWIVWIGVNKKSMYCGGYESKEEAAEVARKVREQVHGAFTNHGHDDFC